MEKLKFISIGRILVGVFFSILFTLYFVGISYSQNEESKFRTRMSLDFYSNNDKTKTIKATVFTIKDRIRNYAINEKVYFYYGERSDENLLDSATTDNNGIAQLDFPEEFRFLTAEDRTISITAYFDGNDSFTEKSADINFIELEMELLLTQIDGSKTIEVRAYEKGIDDEMIPVKIADISYYVPRYFSDQKIGESDFTVGKSSIKFPDNIAGDTIGNISILARIEDHSIYGNVERSITNFRWGTTQPIEDDKSLMTIEITIPTRALWHTNAPLWMIITLIILLTGVWSHYIYVIFQLKKIHGLGKKNKLSQPAK